MNVSIQRPTHSEYRFMTYSDKVKAFGVTEELTVNDIVKIIRDFYDNCDHEYDSDELMAEADRQQKRHHR